MYIEYVRGVSEGTNITVEPKTSRSYPPNDNAFRLYVPFVDGKLPPVSQHVLNAIPRPERFSLRVSLFTDFGQLGSDSEALTLRHALEEETPVILKRYREAEGWRISDEYQGSGHEISTESGDALWISQQAAERIQITIEGAEVECFPVEWNWHKP